MPECACLCLGAHLEPGGGGQLYHISFPSTLMWVLGLNLGHQALAVRVFIHHTTLSTPAPPPSSFLFSPLWLNHRPCCGLTLSYAPQHISTFYFEAGFCSIPQAELRLLCSLGRLWTYNPSASACEHQVRLTSVFLKASWEISLSLLMGFILGQLRVQPASSLEDFQSSLFPVYYTGSTAASSLEDFQSSLSAAYTPGTLPSS